MRGSGQRAQTINAVITEKIALLEHTIAQAKLRGELVTADALKHSVEREVGWQNDFFTHADLYVDQLRQEGKLYTAKRYANVRDQLRNHIGAKLPLESITPAFLRAYRAHRKHRGNKETTVVSHLKAIRAIYNRAREDGAMPNGPSAFASLKIGDPQGVIVRLTIAEIKQITEADLAVNTGAWRARDYLLFSVYCAGIRFRDLCLMSWNHVVPVGDGRFRLEYTMSKTKMNKSILLTSRPLAILARYGTPGSNKTGLVFPLLVGCDVLDASVLMRAVQSRNALVNKDLKKVGKLAGVATSFSYYASRHSYADIARRAGESIYDISSALGHSSIKQTETYLDRFDSPALDQHMERLWGD